MEPIKVDFTGKDGNGKGSGKDAYLTPKNSAKKLIISIVGTLIGAFAAYYFMLPPLNFKSVDTYIYFGIVAFIFVALTFVTSSAFTRPEYVPFVKKRSIVPMIFVGILVAVVVIGGIISSAFFRAKSYSRIITVDDSKTFVDDISEVDFSSVPVLDTDAATVLANRTLGDLAEIGKVSQFELSTEFTQINYKNNPVKVTTLAYGDVFKWLKNTGTGLPGYVVVNMVTQKAELVTLPEGEYIRYSPNEHFSKYLMRHVRFSYPTYIFDQPRFEIDESGRPFWLCPVLDKTIGLFGGTDVKGVVIVDAITGDMVEYSVDEVRESKELQWIDGIYSDDLLVEQFDYYGKYQNGFINSIIGQSGVKLTTEGTNYIAKDDDVFTYTGVTSAGNDQAIIGFVLINMRTKEANFYSISGAKEMSAMSSAQGDVQDYAYKATFPILLNVSGQPTYFMSLKDADNLVKRYAMVNVQNYQVAVTGATIAECTRIYAEKLEQNNIKVDVDLDQLENIGNENQNNEAEIFTVSGEVTDIRTAVIDGNSVYFIELDGSGIYYSIKASQQEMVVILNEGDTITVSYKEAEGEIISASSIEEAAETPDEPATEENTEEAENEDAEVTE
ncbi:MAG: CvpA family protein [Clostridia bacterium]|nr:CvpA family protein [Clostridia bacterium]